MRREELVKTISELSSDISSNVKFITLLYSRLMEDDISPEQSRFICSCIDFDFSNVPEDDDTLSDIATEYSTYCVRVVKQVQLHGYADKLNMFGGLFRNFRLEVEH